MATLRSLAAYTFLALYIVLLGPPVLAVAWLASSQRLIIDAGRIGTAIALALAGIRYTR